MHLRVSPSSFCGYHQCHCCAQEAQEEEEEEDWMQRKVVTFHGHGGMALGPQFFLDLRTADSRSLFSNRVHKLGPMTLTRCSCMCGLFDSFRTWVFQDLGGQMMKLMELHMSSLENPVMFSSPRCMNDEL